MFHDRKEAGQRLAQELLHKSLSQPLMKPLVLALPRGGVPVGMEIAQAIKAPLDVLVIRKIGAPGNPEYGIGAVTESGYLWIDHEAVEGLGISEEALDSLIRHEKEEIQRRIQKYRGGRSLTDVKDKTVILVDDGLATGVTAIAAAQFLKSKGAKRIVLAIPVGAKNSLQTLSAIVDDVICLETPYRFLAVGLWYEDFSQTTDEEVIQILSQNTQSSLSYHQEDGKREKLGGFESHEIEVKDGGVSLPGRIMLPPSCQGIVIFAHGSGSSRFSPRNMEVARNLNEARLGTLLFDLLSPTEATDRQNVFNIPLLAERLIQATRFLKAHPKTAHLPLGYFGASTGGAAALWAAAEMGREIFSVVSRGGRPDLAMPRLGEVDSPTLLIVGENDAPVIELNQRALKYLKSAKLLVIPGATHLFQEPGTLEAVSCYAAGWFLRHLEQRGILNEAA